MLKHTLLIAGFVCLLALPTAAQTELKNLRNSREAMNLLKKLEKQIDKETAKLYSPNKKVKSVEGESELYKHIKNASKAYVGLDAVLKKAEQSKDEISEGLRAQGFVVLEEGGLQATTPESLELLRRNEMLLDTEKSFTTADLSAYRPKLKHANARVALPEAFRRDFETRYLGYKYVGLRVSGKKDINAALKEFKSSSVTKDLLEMLEETENPPIMEGPVWLKTMKGLHFQLEIPDGYAALFNDFEPNKLPVPYQVVGLVDVGVNWVTSGELAYAEFWPDMISRIMMLLEIDGKQMWCEVEITRKGLFKVTPFL